MRRTGMSRPIDELGRIVIPMEIRLSLGLKPGMRLDIGVANDKIVLKRDEAFCACCGKTHDHMLSYSGVNICPDCIAEFDELKEDGDDE